MILFERPKDRLKNRLSSIRLDGERHFAIDDYSENKIEVKNVRRRKDVALNRGNRIGNIVIEKISAPSQVMLGGSGETLSFKIIKRMLRTQVIAFCVGLITSIMKSLPWTVKCRDPLIKSILEKTLEDNYSSIIDGAVTSFYNGFAFSQKKVEKKRTVFTEYDEETEKSSVVFDQVLDLISKIKWIDPDDTRIEYHYNVATDEIEQIVQRLGSMNDWITVPRSDLIWHSSGSPFSPVFGRTVFMDIYTPWEILNILMRYALEETDRNSAPPVVVSYPEGFTNIDGVATNHRDVAYEIARDVIESVAIAIPSNAYKDSKSRMWDVSIIKDWSTSGYDAIRKQIDFCNALIALGLGVPTQLSPFNTKAGAAGAGEVEVGLEMLMFRIEPMINAIRDTIKRDVLDFVLMMNLSEESIIPYEFTIDKTIFNRRQLAKEVLLNQLQVHGQLLTSGRGAPSHIPDIDSLTRLLGLPMIRTSELVDMEEVDEKEEIEEDSTKGPLSDKLQNDKDNTVNRKTKRRSRAGQKSVIISGS